MKAFLSAAMVASLLASTALARNWTSRDGGFSVDAELEDVKDGKAVLKKTDGTQVSVPLRKLSLSDVRYIEGVLKSADAAVSGGKAESPAGEKPTEEKPTADKATDDSEPEAAAASAASVKAPLLRYQWKKSQTYVYRVKISGDRGHYTEDLAGNVTYKVKSIDGDEIQLAMTSNLTGGQLAAPSHIVIIGRHVRFVSDVDKPKETVVTVDPLGKVERIEGTRRCRFFSGTCPH